MGRAHLRIGHVGGDVVGHEDPRTRLADDLLRRVAQDCLGAGVPTGDPAIQAAGEDRVVDRALDDHAVALMRFLRA